MKMPASLAVGKKQPAENNIDKDDVNETPLDYYFLWTDNREMLDCSKCLPGKECYLNTPDNMVDNNPLDMENIKKKLFIHMLFLEPTCDCQHGY
jgi:hypothetical protein